MTVNNRNMNIMNFKNLKYNVIPIPSSLRSLCLHRAQHQCPPVLAAQHPMRCLPPSLPTFLGWRMSATCCIFVWDSPLAASAAHSHRDLARVESRWRSEGSGGEESCYY